MEWERPQVFMTVGVTYNLRRGCLYYVGAFREAAYSQLKLVGMQLSQQVVAHSCILG